jgi:hypothetical protein
MFNVGYCLDATTAAAVACCACSPIAEATAKTATVAARVVLRRIGRIVGFL